MNPTFRREVHLGLFAPLKNMLSRTLLGELRMGACVADCSGKVVTDDSVVTTTATEIRYPEGMALTTEIINRGANRIAVYEDDCLVFFVAPGASRRHPLSGQGRLTAIADSGSSAVTVATNLRCSCAFPGEPYAAPEDVVAPIGSFLL